jgi:hypothetical protein
MGEKTQLLEGGSVSPGLALGQDFLGVGSIVRSSQGEFI